MLSFCLLHSEMVAPKMEMKSSPCFLEVSPVLAQGLDKRGGGKAAPLFQPQAAWFHIFSALICYPCHACFITPILLPSQVLRNGDQCPWEAIALIMHAKLLQSCQTLNLWTVAHQDPLSMGFSRQEYWSGQAFPSPGDLPYPKMELPSSALAGRFFTTEPPGKPHSLMLLKSYQKTGKRPLQFLDTLG